MVHSCVPRNCPSRRAHDLSARFRIRLIDDYDGERTCDYDDRDLPPEPCSGTAQPTAFFGCFTRRQRPFLDQWRNSDPHARPKD